MSKADSETFLNIDFVLKSSEPLMQKNQVIAYAQWKLKDGNISAKHMISDYDSHAKSIKTKYYNKKKETTVSLSSDNASISFDKRTGLITEYSAFGNTFLSDGGSGY